MNRTPPSPEAIWREFHWAFFINVQALIISLKRFKYFLDKGLIEEAEDDLSTAANLLIASAASMDLAASFSREVYETTIRTSMMPPAVRSDGFSGLMSWEHGVLVNLWRELRPQFGNLPDELAPTHAAFVHAYRHLAESHTSVCARFVGDSSGSLRFSDRDAIETLRRYGRGRMSLIDPQETVKGCPASL
ncbi:siderophore biosynthesis protein [Marinivivus vitaminiproducens]|uniref:siderophore biosynthesis protein n=1 Tax=Marinivivus vitaminiproducens TaxID=3035935 RepID=UPI0027A0F2A5|nr:hypothetical protein P4R82_20740 [Geminicoccaceae bacterium SCSIO 64248]